MKLFQQTFFVAGLAVLFAGLALLNTAAAQSGADALIAKAKGIHDRVIKLDTHNDIAPANFTAECNYTMRLTTQVNLPKMVDGDMDVSFLIAYTGQGPLTPEGFDNAYRQAVEKFDAVHRLTEQIAPDQVGLALTPADVVELHKQGKRIAVIGVENGYPVGMDIKRVEEFYNRGGRYMSLAHNGNSQLADSNTGETRGYLYDDGLSGLGREVIAEMNRLGMMVDLSHPAKGANLEAMRLSQAPVFASHSSVRAVADHSRNMDDEQLLALKQNGGVIQIVGFAAYVKVNPPERAQALAALREELGLGGRRSFGGAASGERQCPVETPAPPTASRVAATPNGLSAEQTAIYEQRMAEIDAKWPAPPTASRVAATPNGLSAEQTAIYEQRMAEIDAKWPAPARANVADMVDHIDYAVKLIGIDHVGISSDFDGGGGIDGWDSAADAFNVTLELVKRGYTEEQIGKLWSGNLLRVWGEVEQVAKQLQAKN